MIKRFAVSALLMGLAVVFLALLWKAKNGDPKPEPTTVITAEAVQMCQNLLSDRRDTDRHCEIGEQGYRWLYLLKSPKREIPAVGNRVRPQGQYDPPPGVTHIVRVPEEGALWPEVK